VHDALAGGRESPRTPQRDLFTRRLTIPIVERSRATMWDVPRFAEYHRYRRIIVENVVEGARWELFDVWLQAMHVLGYRHRIVSLNSMFCGRRRSRATASTSTSGGRATAPDLDIPPKAPCRSAARRRGVQTWKNGRTWGSTLPVRLHLPDVRAPRSRRSTTPRSTRSTSRFAAERIGDRVAAAEAIARSSGSGSGWRSTAVARSSSART
jgi:site-specific DNA-cytosine methylase